MKTLISRSAVLMGIESLALDAEGEYKAVAESLGGVNIVLGPASQTIINLFDVEPKKIKDAITGKERTILNIEKAGAPYLISVPFFEKRKMQVLVNYIQDALAEDTDKTDLNLFFDKKKQ